MGPLPKWQSNNAKRLYIIARLYAHITFTSGGLLMYTKHIK